MSEVTNCGGKIVYATVVIFCRKDKEDTDGPD